MNLRRKLAFFMALSRYVEMIVSGIPPLSLVKAKANSLTSLKAFGGTEQSGVPSGYTAVEYVENATDGMVKSAIHIGNEDNFKMDITATVVSGSFYLFQARDVVGQNYGNATICGISGSQNGGTIIAGSGGSTSLTSGITRPNRDGHKLNIVFDCTDGDMSLYVKDIDGNVSATKTGTYNPAELTRPATNMCIYGNEAPTISSALPKNRLAAGCKVYGAKLWKNGVLVLDYVPAIRNSDSAIGFYDRISDTFVTAADGSLTAGSSLAPTPSDPVDLVCNNGKISVLDHTNWNVITNPNSETGKGMFINTNGVLSKANDRGAGVFIPVTVGKQYTLLINKKNTALGSIIRYGQSNNSEPPSSSEQLVDWYRGAIETMMIISFTAKRPYFVMQLAASLVEAGGIDEAVEVIEAQGGDYTFLEYLVADGNSWVETNLSGAARWVGAGQATSESTGSKCILGALTSSGNASVYLASRFGGSTDARNKRWTIDGASGATSVSGLTYAKYDIDYQENTFTGTINAESTSRTNTDTFTTWFIGSSRGISGGVTTNYPFVGNIYRQQAYQNNVLVGDFIPAIRNSDNVVGMYDTVSGQFYTNAGSGNFTAGTVVSDGEVLSMLPSGQMASVNNLFKLNTYQDIQEIITGATTHNCGIKIFDGTEDFLDTGVNGCYSWVSDFIKTVAADSNRLLLCTHFWGVDSNTLPETYAGRQGGVFKATPTNDPTASISFGAKDDYATIAAFQSFLAAQYAAGTPVIVVYPLATPFEEPAPIAQTMTVVDGDNTVSLTQQGMTPLTLEATYQKAKY